MVMALPDFLQTVVALFLNNVGAESVIDLALDGGATVIFEVNGPRHCDEIAIKALGAFRGAFGVFNIP
jgi:basic membrane lipoprotein Med (substrate-binding protein (PBP1-ABC) superfamily)